MNDNLLRVRDMSAGYPGVPVLRGINLAVRRGEIVALVGSNGAGKTTLLRALSGIIPCTGRIEFEGHDISARTPDQIFGCGVVQVPEGRQLFERMTVYENLLMGAYRRDDRSGIDDSLERVYSLLPILRARSTQRAGSMSGGEQQMCAIARALMASPKLLLVDEMSLGLAPVVVDQLLDAMLEIRNQGVTVFLVEQDVFSALRIADRGYVLETGTVVREGPAGALAENAEVRHAYLGL